MLDGDFPPSWSWAEAMIPAYVWLALSFILDMKLCFSRVPVKSEEDGKKVVHYYIKPCRVMLFGALMVAIEHALLLVAFIMVWFEDERRKELNSPSADYPYLLSTLFVMFYFIAAGVHSAFESVSFELVSVVVGFVSLLFNCICTLTIGLNLGAGHYSWTVAFIPIIVALVVVQAVLFVLPCLSCKLSKDLYDIISYLGEEAQNQPFEDN